MKGLPKALLIVAVIAVLASVLLYTWRMRPENAIVVAPGGEIQYDDFAFSVDAVQRLPSLVVGSERVAAKGEYVVVTLGIRNHAQRVDFTFRPETVRLVADGAAPAEYTPVPTLIAPLAAAGGCNVPLPAGESCTTQIAFDVPAGIQGLRVRLQFAGDLFDAIDTLVYGRMSMALPEG